VNRITKFSDIFLPSRTRAGKPRWMSVGLALSPVICAVLWVLSVKSIDLGAMTDLGLVSVFRPGNFAALAILIAGFSVSISQRELNEPLLVWHAFVLLVLIHATPLMLYGTLRYSWAWKHVGIIDYIGRHGGVDRGIAALSAYHNWPGFFALNALITDTAGVSSPLSYAPWAPVFFNLVFLATLPFIFRTFTSDRRLIWLAVWFFFLTNWVGQDYFAPQAMGYFLYLVIIGVSLRWFSATPNPQEPGTNVSVLNRVVTFFRTRALHTSSADLTGGSATPSQRIGLLAVVVPLMAAIASSHQLTPFMMVCSLAALVVFRRCSARSLPIIAAVLTVAWLFYFATPFLMDNIDSMTETMGQFLDNVDSNLIDTSRASPGHRTVSLVGRALTVFLWGIAVLGGIRRLAKGYLDMPAVLLGLSPFLMLAGNSYGGEILFRVYFFSLPFMVYLGATLLYPAASAGRSWLTTVFVALISASLLAGLLFAYYGKERQYSFTREEIAAARYIYETAPPGSLLVEGSRNYPSQFLNYENFTYVPISREPERSQSNVINRPVETLSRWMANEEYAATYLIITRSMKAETQATGQMPPSALEKVESALLESTEFEVVFGNEDAKVFVLSERAGR
jgi:hypothetical protein